MSTKISIIIPVYNEEQVLPFLYKRLENLIDKIGMSTEIILVDDGSSDNTRNIIRIWAKKNLHYKALLLSRNYGHQIAITAGLDHAKGDAVIIMDADLQDPPEIIPRMIEKWRQGFHVVYAQRLSRQGESWTKKITASIFYHLIRTLSSHDIPPNTGDFRLMDRKVVDAFKRMPEQFRFVRGLVSWVGFRQCPIFFERPPRQAGVSKYPWKKMLRFAFDAIFSFSTIPLKLASYFGLIVTLLSAIMAIHILYQRIVTHSVVPGLSGLAILILFFGGVNLLVSGILGEYIGRIYVESKARPLYFVEEIISQGDDALV